MKNNLDDFAVFILTNGRPDNVITYKTLQNSGYTGRVYLVVDDLDKTKDKYLEKYGDQVIIFDKKAIAATFDEGDNFNDMRAIIYARNACFKIAEDLGITYFIQLDDDYTSFNFRFNKDLKYSYSSITNLDLIFHHLLDFYINTNVDSIAMAQGGDFIGGVDGTNASVKSVLVLRKCMNSFLCSTKRPFKFVGRVNEDVNTYTRLASTGLLLFTINQISLQQKQTQTNQGGMTEMYLDSGTYVKSFYTVMYHPSSVKIKMMQSKFKRLHHSVRWDHTVPLILDESFKKK
jgi:hypothetical protein